MMSVLGEASGERGIAQQPDHICGESFFVAYGREQSGALMLDEIRHALRRGGDHGSARRKSFDDRQWHVVEPRAVDKNVSLVVILADFLTRGETGEVDAGEMQVRNQFADIA